MIARKIKLALTVGLINRNNTNVLRTAQELMAGFREEAGKFVGTTPAGQQEISQNMTLQRYALRFEKVTLDLELVCDTVRRQEIVQSFKLR